METSPQETFLSFRVSRDVIFALVTFLGCSYLQFKRTKKKILSQPNLVLMLGER